MSQEELESSLRVQGLDYSDPEEDFGYELVVIHPTFEELQAQRAKERAKEEQKRRPRMLVLGGPDREQREPNSNWRRVWKSLLVILLVISIPVGISYSAPASSILGFLKPSTPAITTVPNVPPPPLLPSYSPCFSEIYCTGELLHVIQTAKIFQDSKTFVDMPLRYPPEEVLRRFRLLTADEKKDKQVLTNFVLSNFLSAGIEVEVTEPVDWIEDPPILAPPSSSPSSPPSPSGLLRRHLMGEQGGRGQENPTSSAPIVNEEARIWAKVLHVRWRLLLRRFNHGISCKTCFSSLPLPNPFLMPGGRFRGPYYWDSYWIIRGLLVSGLQETVKGIILNFGFMIEKLGFVPNGARLFYLNRSQPPLLAKMCDIYLARTGDHTFLKRMTPLLDREYEFWMLHRSVYVEDSQGTLHLMNFYNVTSDVPRPESYLEDLKLGATHSEEKRKYIFAQMASGAESGWDYSTRWLEGEDLDSIMVNQIVPVDLNAIIYDMEMKLSKFHQILGNRKKGLYYELQGTKRRAAMDLLFWNSTESHWKDYNLKTREHAPDFYISAVTPLWMGAHNRSKEELLDFVNSLERMLVFQCGIPTSNSLSDQQWDYPNAWAPLQHATIEGLEKIQDKIPQAKVLAQKLAVQWLDCNFCGWNSTGGVKGGDMFEKYDVTRKGVPGGAGEYEVQVGFGWTNGVALDLLEKYGRFFVPSHCPSGE